MAKTYRTEVGSVPDSSGNDQPTTFQVPTDSYAYHYKQGTPRIRPKGVEKLFAPTTMMHMVQKGTDEMVMFSGKILTGTWASGHYVTYDKPVIFFMPNSATGGYGRPTTFLDMSENNNPLLAKIKNQNLNLAMFLAEFRDTSTMFVDTAKFLLKSYRDVKRGRIPGWIHKPSVAASSTWLTYRLGVMPLVYDLQSALEMLYGTDATPIVHRISVVSRRGQTSSTTPKKWYYGGYFQDVGGMVSTMKTTHRDVAHVQYTHSPFQTAMQLGFTNPALLAWELTPLSFVVDRVIGVGEYLAGLDALIGVSRWSATRTKLMTTTEIYPGNAVGNATSFYRRALSSLTPTPPRWEPSDYWKHTMDHVALLRTMSARTGPKNYLLR